MVRMKMKMHNRQTDEITDDGRRRARLIETTCKIQLKSLKVNCSVLAYKRKKRLEWTHEIIGKLDDHR